MKNILIATDFSEYADKAIKTAAKMAINYDSNLILFHHFETPEGYLTDESSTSEFPQDLFYGKLAYQKMEEQLVKCGVDTSKVTMVVTKEKYKKEMKRIVNEHDIDLILFGYNFKNTYFDRFSLSKRIKKIINSVNIPVMIISDSIEDFSLDNLVYVSDVNDEDFFSFSKLLLFASKSDSNLHLVNIEKPLKKKKMKAKVEVMASLCEMNNLELSVYDNLFKVKYLKHIDEKLDINVSGYGVTKNCLSELMKFNKEEEMTINNLIVF